MSAAAPRPRAVALVLQAPLLFVALTLLHGTVTVGPTSPVCRVGEPCTKPAAHTALTFTRAGYVNRRVSTDAAGRYRVSLAAGTWTLRTTLGIRPAPVRFFVPRAPTATRNFSFDTGIR